MLLAIDTSTMQSGLACYTAEELLGECSWNSGRNHTTQVLAQLDLLLRHIGRRTSDIQAVAVARGPGSWSGLRVGMSLAKGIALAGNLPLIGIGTLDALAYQQQQPLLPIYPLISLGRERVATARFQLTTTWQRQSEYLNLSLPELAHAVANDDQVLFCGDTPAPLRESLRELLGSQAQFVGAATALRRTGYLAELAWQRLQRGEQDVIATLEPIYLGDAVRIPAASTTDHPPPDPTDAHQPDLSPPPTLEM